MSGYSARSGVNVSQYLANLNAIPSPQDTPTESQSREDEFALFMNTDFFDQFTDAGTADLGAPLANFDLDPTVPSVSADSIDGSAPGPSDSNIELGINGDFQFADFSNFTNPIIDPAITSLPHPQTNAFSGTSPNFTSPVSSTVSPVAPSFDQTSGKKRKLDGDVSSQQAIDEAARVAAEEDKRRRNTAASARFRIKKKQREQALEKTAKEMSDRVALLESRISQLETENTWLKGLITEKNGGKTSTSEIRALLSKHEEDSERSTGNRTDGVGTKPASSKA